MIVLRCFGGRSVGSSVCRCRALMATPASFCGLELCELNLKKGTAALGFFGIGLLKPYKPQVKPTGGSG